MVELNKKEWRILQAALNLVSARENISKESMELLRKARAILQGKDYEKQDQKNLAC